MIIDAYPWTGEGQELLATPSVPGRWKRIVACLNVWNDIDELRANWDSWYPYVDAVIAVDGAYSGTPVDVPESTDLTREFLQTHQNVTLVSSLYFWKDQRVKRSRYFRHGRPGDLLFVVDADEYVLNGEVLQQVPELDVGWVTYTSPVYKRPQHTPRFIRWREGLSYEGRHHWLAHNGRPLCTHQIGGAGYDHRLVPLGFHNTRGVHRTPERRKLMTSARIDQVDEEFSVGDRVLGHEPLRIFQTGPFDPGNVVYRLHTAINTTSPHESAMATGDLGPFAPPRQYEFEKDRLVLRDLMATADVLHFHVMRVAGNYLEMPQRNAQPLVMHHHGTEYRRDPFTWNERDADADARLVSNLELLQYGERLEYLPNPVPVARYQRLADHVHDRMRADDYIPTRLAVAHSPTKHGLKGTEMFLRVCESLNKIVEPVLIENKPLWKSLDIKATCGACFDSFWLGMQCSGLEAAAMGMPVIAGDADCQREYIARYGFVPYTFANDEAALKAALERLAVDVQFYGEETAHVSAFVAEYHDYASVVEQYLDILDKRLGWREGLRLGNRLPLARTAARV